MRTIQHHHGAYIIGRKLVQSDRDYPAAAGSCGWSLARVQKRGSGVVALTRISRKRLDNGQDCRHLGTDGTIDCQECGVTASQFIHAADSFLSYHAR